jgi:hypothetical protein
MERPDDLNLSRQEGEALIERLHREAVTAQDRRVLEQVLRWYFWLRFALQEARFSLKRLRAMVVYEETAQEGRRSLPQSPLCPRLTAPARHRPRARSAPGMAVREHRPTVAPRTGIVTERTATDRGEPVDAFAEVDRLCGDKDPTLRGQLEHQGVSQKVRTKATSGGCGS